MYEKKREYKKALLYQDTVIALTKEADGEYHPNHIIELNNKANIYEKASEFDKAIEIRQMVVNQQLSKDELAEESFDYLLNLANSQRKKGDLKVAIKNYELIAINRKRKEGEGVKYANSLSTLGVAYYEAGNFNKSQKCYFESLELHKKFGHENTADYAMVLNNLAVLYYQQGDFFAAEQNYLKAQEIRKKTIGENHPNYIYTLNGLAVLYHESGNYKKAEPLYLQGLELTKNDEFDSEIKFTLLTNLAELYELTERYNEAADTYSNAYQLGWKLYGKNNLNFAKLVKKVAGFYKKIKDFGIADSLYSESLLAIDNAVGKNNSDYAGTLNNRGELYIRTKEYEKAEKDLLESAALTKKLFGEFHYQYSVLLNNLAALYFEMGKVKKCEENLISANEIIINKVNESVNYMTEQESEAFLNSTDYLFNTYYSFYFNEKERNPQLADFAYDNVLARKGLMLQAEKNLRKSVLQTGDSLLINDYLEFIALKEKQGRLFTSNQQISDDSLKLISERAEILEKRVTTHPKIINSRAQINIAGWKDIKKSLQKDEVAIEFIAFRYYNLFYTDSIFYCALILKPGYKNPKMIFLFEEKQLDKLLKKAIIIPKRSL
ncbi:MAG: tetratricopeptide repeat protein [Chloroflexia bacterium]|nr:tetratricopeptide repeat protein [Chloroflexia bacterium]